MKLFGNQKKGDEKSGAGGSGDDDFNDSPSETVSLSDPKPAAAGKGATATSAGGASAGQAASVARPASRPMVEDEPRPTYGIEQAIQLMRALPVDQNVELVVQVIKTTLESLKVRVGDIIEDAVKRERDLQGRVETLKKEISEYEREISQRKETIGKLEADHTETTSVKQRLELAEKAQKSQKVVAAGGK